jgi:hypothetical protein
MRLSCTRRRGLLFKPGRERTRVVEDKGAITKRARWRYLPSAPSEGVEEVSSR